MFRKKIFILGAGLSGLSAAWFIQRKGIDCQVIEKEPEVGGLCRSKKINGFTFDLDGHLLHFKHPSIFNLIKGLLGDNLVKHERNAWIYTYGRFLSYPFQANLHTLPHSVIKDCILGLMHISRDTRFKDEKERSFLDWINHMFGKGIAKHFMVPYNTKFWTVYPNKLNCDWVDGFVPVPTLNQIIEGTMDESKKKFGYNAHFWYPKEGGINQLPLAFARQIKNIHTNCKILEINLGSREIKMSSGNKEKFDYLISTIPLPEMGCLIRRVPLKIKSAFKKLRWNSIFNLNLGINYKDYNGRHWIYFPEKEPCFFRVGFPHNFSPSVVPADKSSLYIEVSYSKYKPFDKANAAKHIKNGLKKAGILISEEKICVEDINDIEYGYPIYDKNYISARRDILEFLFHNHIIPCGRYGSWRYMSMEDSILDGREMLRYFAHSRA